MPGKKPTAKTVTKPKQEVNQEVTPLIDKEKFDETIKELQGDIQQIKEPKYFKLYQVGFAHYNYFVPAVNERAAEESLRQQEPSMRPLPIKAIEVTTEGYRILCEKVE